MAPSLTFEYRIDWRYYSAHFWYYGGRSHLAAAARRSCVTHALLLAVLGIAAVLAALTGSWMWLSTLISLGIWIAVTLTAQSNLAKLALFGMRRSFRQHPAKTLLLRVDEEGLHETDAGAVSFAPWSTVKRFVNYRGMLSIELSGGQFAIVSGRTLTKQSSTLGELVAYLQARGIAEGSTREGVATGAA